MRIPRISDCRTGTWGNLLIVMLIPVLFAGTLAASSAEAAAPPPRATDQAAGEDIPANPVELLQVIETRMRDVQQLLSARNVSAETQRNEQQIVQDLNRLIEQLQQRQGQASSAGQRQKVPAKKSPGSKPTSKAGRQPARGSRDPAGQATDAPADEEARERAMSRLWGQLPERFRRQLQSVQQIDFLPRYRQLIEDYYRRLAEEP